MDINKIESNLNNHEGDYDKVISAILNGVAKNQAILETLLDLQLTLITSRASEEEAKLISKSISETIETKLALIQARIASKLQ